MTSFVSVVRYEVDSDSGGEEPSVALCDWPIVVSEEVIFEVDTRGLCEVTSEVNSEG